MVWYAHYAPQKASTREQQTKCSGLVFYLTRNESADCNNTAAVQEYGGNENQVEASY